MSFTDQLDNHVVRYNLDRSALSRPLSRAARDAVDSPEGPVDQELGLHVSGRGDIGARTRQARGVRVIEVRADSGGLVAAKVDFKRELPCYTAKHGSPQITDVPDLQYLMIDGHGDPNTPAYGAAVSALYPVAYKLKFASKNDLGRDYVVMPLEGLWWADDMNTFTTARDKAQWDWTLMIMVPDWITPEMFGAAVEELRSDGSPERLDDVRLEALCEGRSVQALHIGAYDDETELLRYMHEEFIPERGLVMVGKHHEIYLSDPRRVEPAKLRTILRQPVADA
jgi:hypothetical protein